MTSEQFAYWLQGFAELNGLPPTEAQWESIKEHLNLVFNKVTKPVVQPVQKLPVTPNDLLLPAGQWPWPNGHSPIFPGPQCGVRMQADGTLPGVLLC